MSDKKIMIVDDDLHLVMGLVPRLKANGYKVISTADAISAVWLARKEMPDLIILDLGLPGGDGFAVLDRMKELPDVSGIPVIVLSAREPSGNKQRALQANASAYSKAPGQSPVSECDPACAGRIDRDVDLPDHLRAGLSMERRRILTSCPS